MCEQDQDCLTHLSDLLNDQFFCPGQHYPTSFYVETARPATPFENVQSTISKTLSRIPDLHDHDDQIVGELIQQLSSSVLLDDTPLPLQTNTFCPYVVPPLELPPHRKLLVCLSFYPCTLFRTSDSPIMDLVCPINTPLIELIPLLRCGCSMIPCPSSETLLYTNSLVFRQHNSVLESFIPWPNRPSDLSQAFVANLQPSTGQEVSLVVGNESAQLHHRIVIRGLRTTSQWEDDRFYQPRITAVYSSSDAFLCDVCQSNGAVFIAESHPLAPRDPSFWCATCLEAGGNIDDGAVHPIII
ncbi:hypothetical protein GEMRC1_006663 [Eukaryota sp. GEM-RC1]